MFALACPKDQSPLDVENDYALCPLCETTFLRRNDIWRFLTNGSYQKFLDQYNVVRRAEYWGTNDPMYFRTLPFVRQTDANHRIWLIRAVSFKTLLGYLNRGAYVLDVGAGNGWLSNQLTLRGHQMAAVDLSDDQIDGLGAQQFYKVHFESFQSDLHHLPFQPAQFDYVIYNGSLHYARELKRAFTEGLRVLKPGGGLIVMDSPTFHDTGSGKQMVEEKARDFRVRFGFELDRSAVGFLTFSSFGDLGRELGLEWHWVESRVGAGRSLGGLLARAKRRRELAHFGLMFGKNGNRATPQEEPTDVPTPSQMFQL